MVYIIFGNQPLMVKKNVKKTIDSFFENKEVDIIKLNSREITEDDIIYECEQMSITSQYKAIVVENASFLTGEKASDKFKYSDKLVDYLTNEKQQDVLLIFSVVYDKKLDSRNKIVKLLTEKKQIKECLDLSKQDWEKYIVGYFDRRGIKISKEAADELQRRCLNDLNIFDNEATKLILFKDGQTTISLKDVEEVVTLPLEDNLFLLQTHLLKGEKGKAIQLFRDLSLLNTVTPVILITLLSNNFYFLDQVKYLNKIRKTPQEMASILKSNPYRIYNTLKDIKDISDDKIKDGIKKLYDLDITIKRKKVDPYYAFEEFILNF